VILLNFNGGIIIPQIVIDLEAKIHLKRKIEENFLKKPLDIKLNHYYLINRI